MLSFEIYKYRLRALYSSRTISIKALNGQAAPSGGPCEVRGAAAAEAPEDDFASVASIEELHGSMYSDGYTSDGYASDGYYSDGEAPSARSSRGPKRASEAKTSETKDSEK